MAETRRAGNCQLVSSVVNPAYTGGCPQIVKIQTRHTTNKRQRRRHNQESCPPRKPTTYLVSLNSTIVTGQVVAGLDRVMLHET